MNENTVSAYAVDTQIVMVNDMLRKSLSEVVSVFKPDKYLTEQLAPFFEEFGHRRNLHEFMIHWVTNEDASEVDILNGEMEPFNIFQVLDPIYRQACR